MRVPDAPIAKCGDIKPESIELTWKDGAYNGGSAITSYTIKMIKGAVSTQYKVERPKMKNIFEPLTAGTDYTFEVTANNAQGDSKSLTAISCKTKPALVAPAVVKNLKCGDQATDTITISWEDGDSDGGSPIT